MDLQPGDIVQVSLENPRWPGCLIVVDEVKNWGIQGYLLLPTVNSARSLPAYFRVETGYFKPTGGRIIWEPDRSA